MDLFEIGKTNNIKRDKFISRFFGIFSEEIANIYFCSPYSEYTNLGRPNISINNKHYILDFTLKNKNNGKIYICEMKCEMQYMKGTSKNHHYQRVSSSFSFQNYYCQDLL